MDRQPSSLQALFAEMKRRHVFRVMAVYGAVAFVVLQVADIAFEPLGLPEWTMTFVLMLAILGFPVAVVLAWAFEQTPEGIRRTESAAPEEIEALVAEPASRRWPAGIAALVGVGLLVGGAWWMGARSAAAGSEDAATNSAARSLAVLPLTTRTMGDAGEGADRTVVFADGMHDDLLTQLQRIADLRVTSRTSVERFRETELDIRDIARQLGVRYIVEGAVDQVGDNIRVNVQLIDASSDGHVWAETYDETMTLVNLFDIRDDLTRRIATSLRATLSPAIEAKIDERPTENPEAFEVYTRGRHLYDRGARPDLERAIELFERAISLDPEFAAAHAALGAVHGRMLAFGFASASTAMPQARASVERALELDPDNAEALMGQAMIQMNEGQSERARRTLDRVLELYPSHAVAHASLGRLYSIRGLDYRAVEQFERAAELDPLAADLGVQLAEALADVGRDREALEQAATVLELHPDFEPAAGALADALQGVGRIDEAIATLRQALQRNPNSIFTNEGLAWALLQTDKEAALTQIERAAELTPDDFPIQGTRAWMFRGAGRFEDALSAARTMVGLAPEYASARATLADALLAIGDTAGANAQLDTVQEAAADLGNFFRSGQVVGTLVRVGRVGDAVEVSRKLVEERPGSVYELGRHARFLFETSPWAAHGPEAALTVFEEARRISPREDHLLAAYGTTLRELGRTAESLRLFEALVEDQPEGAWAHMQLGWELLTAQKDAAAAEVAFRRSLAINPAESAALWGMAQIHARAGRAADAVAAIDRAAEVCGAPGCASYYEVREAWVRAVAGDATGARELLERYEGWRDHPDRPEWLPVFAATHAELGNIDRAFRLLDEAYGTRSTRLLELKVEPWFDPLRDDPRFDALLERMGLTP